MDNYENKELLKDAAKKSLESLKDLKPGTDEYNAAANMALSEESLWKHRLFLFCPARKIQLTLWR